MIEVIGAGICREVHAPSYGRQDIGYSPGGPVDRFSMQVGNIMLGNDDFAPALEIIFTSVLQFKQDCQFVLTGAKRSNSYLQQISSHYETSVSVVHGTITYAQAGDRITFGQTVYGLRTYLCQKTFDQGKAPTSQQSLLGRSKPPYREICPGADSNHGIRVLEGPDCRYLEDASLFLNNTWKTTVDISDMGIRLSSPGSRQPVTDLNEMVSAPVNDGTIQLTPDGPIVLLRSRPTTGGYPRIYNVVGSDLDLLGQYGPNQIVRFSQVTETEARCLAIERKQNLDLFRQTWICGGK